MTEYHKIPSREMFERLNHGLETFVEYREEKYVVKYSETFDEYLLFEINDSTTYGIQMFQLFHYNYYVRTKLNIIYKDC